MCERYSSSLSCCLRKTITGVAGGWSASGRLQFGGSLAWHRIRWQWDVFGALFCPALSPTQWWTMGWCLDSSPSHCWCSKKVRSLFLWRKRDRPLTEPIVTPLSFSHSHFFSCSLGTLRCSFRWRRGNKWINNSAVIPRLCCLCDIVFEIYFVVASIHWYQWISSYWCPSGSR